MKSPVQLFIAIAIMLATATVAAQVYKWVDKDGKVQYSDQPPPVDAKDVKGTAKKIDARSASGTAPVTAPPAATKDATKGNAKDGKANPKEAPKTLADRNKDFEKRRADEAAEAKKAEEAQKLAKANEERCEQASRYLLDLQSGRPLVSSDKNGDRKIMNDDERSKELARTNSAKSESCKK